MIPQLPRSVRRWLSLAAVTAVLVLAGIGAVRLARRLLRGRREGWRFEGDRELSPSQGKLISDACATGATMSSIRKKDEWQWMSRYSKESGEKWCRQGAAWRNRQVAANSNLDPNVGPLAEQAAALRRCKSKALCRNSVLGAVKPCASQDRTKCCDWDGKFCRPIADVAYDPNTRNVAGAAVKFYKDENLSGQSSQIDVSDLKVGAQKTVSIPAIWDQVTSLSIPVGYEVRYHDENADNWRNAESSWFTRGDTKEGNVMNVGKHWNDRIASVTIRRYR
jgi:hypothetical protein